MSDLTPMDFMKDLVVLTVDSLEHSAVGNLVNCECPHCHKTTSLQEFQGNVIDGLICPFCRFQFEDTVHNITTSPSSDIPIPREVRDRENKM